MTDKKTPKPSEEIVEEIKLREEGTRVYLDKDGIIHWVITQETELPPPEEIRNVQELLDATFKLAKKNSKKIRLFADFRKSKGAGRAETRKLVIDTFKTGAFEKAAIYTKSVFIRVAIKLTAGFVKKYTDVKFFDDREKALKWLKE